MRWTLFLCLLVGSGFAVTGQDLYDPKKFTEIRISFEQPDWKGLLDSMKDLQTEERLIAKEVIINGIKYPEVGVRYKGNSSFNSVRKSGQDKLPLNVKLDYIHKESQVPGGFTTLKLANGFRDPSMVREALAYEIARNYMPASRANYAKVYVNDQFLGLYTSVESVDKAFLERFFGESSGSLIKGEPDWRAVRPKTCPEADRASLQFLGQDTLCYSGLYEIKGPNAWSDLIAFTSQLKDHPTQMDQILDIDQTLWMLAFSNVLVNLDSYMGAFAQNYYLYRDTFGIFHPIIWDLNLAFGGFRFLGDKQVLSNLEMQQLSMFTHYKDNNAKRPLIVELLRNELYRKIYVAHCKTILEDYFFNGKYKQRIVELQRQIAPVVAADSQKLYSIAAFQANPDHTQEAHGDSIIGITELMEPRIEYFRTHALIAAADPVISEIKTQLQANATIIQAKVTGAKQVWVFYRTPDNSRFRSAPMTPTPGAGPDNWSASLPGTSGIKYYLVGEGERTATLSPRKAAFEPYEVK